MKLLFFSGLCVLSVGNDVLAASSETYTDTHGSTATVSGHSTSTNYSNHSSMGQSVVVGEISSSTYSTHAGFFTVLRTVFPEVTAITRAAGSANPSHADSVAFTVTFSEPVSGIDTTDFELAITGTARGTIASVSAASGDSVTVTVNNITGAGTLGLNLVDDDTISNSNGVVLGGTGTSGVGDGSFIGNIYTIENAAPTFTSTAITAASEDVAYSYSITTNDVDDAGSDLTITATSKPDWLSLTDNGDGTATLNGTPAQTDVGEHDVTVKVADDDGASSEQTFKVTVAAVNDAPTITSTVITAASEDVAYSYSITTNDVDDAGSDLTITATSKPDWLTLTDNGDGTATLNGTPAQTDVGEHDVTLQVADDDGASSEQTFTVTVAAVNDKPTFTSTALPETDENVVYRYSITTDDVDNPGSDLHIAAVLKPDWLVLTDHRDGTATLSGTPVRADVGAHRITLSVTDTDGASSDQSFTLTVIEQNAAPSMNLVTVVGNPSVGRSLTGMTGLFSDPDAEDTAGVHTYQWSVSDSIDCSIDAPIVGATDLTYTLTANEAGHYVCLSVTPVDSRGLAGTPVTGATQRKVRRTSYWREMRNTYQLQYLRE